MRCAAAAGAAPIVVVVERVPQALQDVFERLRLDGVGVFPVSDVEEAVSRFEAGSMILLIGDGVAPPAELVAQLAERARTGGRDGARRRGACGVRADRRATRAGPGVALVDRASARLDRGDARRLGPAIDASCAGRSQEGALRRAAPTKSAASRCWPRRAEQLEDFQRTLLAASRGARTDWASRYVLPPVEEFATEQLMETRVRPGWLIWAALALTLGGAFCFTRGWLGAGLGLLALSTPLDMVASRLATLRLRPLAARMLSRLALWPAAGIALLALGWWEMRHGTGWGALVTAIAAAAFAEAARHRAIGDAGRRRHLAVFAAQCDLCRHPLRSWRALDGLSAGDAGLCRGCLSSSSSTSGISRRVDAKLTEIR